MRIKSIKPSGRADVYNLEVDDTHDYAIENGVIVHNCRYVLMENPITAPLPKPIPTIPAFDPLNMYKR